MPVLAAYIGYSGVSVALEKQDGSFIFQRFPYSYSAELFSSVCDENVFYTQVLEGVAKENKMKLADFDVLMTGFVNFPLPDLNIKLLADVKDLLSKHEENFPVLVDESVVMTKDLVLSQVPINFLTNNEFFANVSIYPQLIKEFNPAIEVDTSNVIENVGTFALAPGDTEVLVSTALDTGQFFDIKKDSVFALPLDNSTSTKLSVKNKLIGNLEGGVVGGTLGLLFDTRVERTQLISDIKIMNAFMREIEEAVKGI